jgi:hypothetical protein
MRIEDLVDDVLEHLELRKKQLREKRRSTKPRERDSTRLGEQRTWQHREKGR